MKGQQSRGQPTLRRGDIPEDEYHGRKDCSRTHQPTLLVQWYTQHASLVRLYRMGRVCPSIHPSIYYLYIAMHRHSLCLIKNNLLIYKIGYHNEAE